MQVNNYGGSASKLILLEVDSPGEMSDYTARHNSGTRESKNLALQLSKYC